MNKSKARFLWILPAVWMVVIFLFSHQPSDDSAQFSGEILKLIESVAEFLRIPTDRLDLHLLVRKTAHFAEFAVLGFLLFLAKYPGSGNTARTGVFAQSVGMGYAVTDEIHQIFVPGRSCQVKDMLIDSSGVLLAVLLCCAYIAVQKRKNKK